MSAARIKRDQSFLSTARKELAEEGLRLPLGPLSFIRNRSTRERLKLKPTEFALSWVFHQERLFVAKFDADSKIQVSLLLRFQGSKAPQVMLKFKFDSDSAKLIASRDFVSRGEHTKKLSRPLRLRSFVSFQGKIFTESKLQALMSKTHQKTFKEYTLRATKEEVWSLLLSVDRQRGVESNSCSQREFFEWLQSHLSAVQASKLPHFDERSKIFSRLFGSCFDLYLARRGYIRLWSAAR